MSVCFGPASHIECVLCGCVAAPQGNHVGWLCSLVRIKADNVNIFLKFNSFDNAKRSFDINYYNIVDVCIYFQGFFFTDIRQHLFDISWCPWTSTSLLLVFDAAGVMRIS